MRLLSNQHRYVKGQMICRSLRPFAAGKRIVLAIPGGPGLGGQYLEPFLLELAKSTGLNVALMDLPNHGESIIRENGTPLDYPRCLALLNSAVGQIAKETGDIVLFGQSFGARLACDLLASSGVEFAAAILMGFPYVFENSSAFEKSLAGVALEDYRGDADDEAVFVRNWRKILPFYTPKPLPPEAVEQLAAGTKWLGNERMVEAVPPLESATLMLKDRKTPILVIQGEQDIIIPDGNLQALKTMIPKAEFREIPDTGHFIMMETPAATLALVKGFLSRIGDRL